MSLELREETDFTDFYRYYTRKEEGSSLPEYYKLSTGLNWEQ